MPWGEDVANDDSSYLEDDYYDPWANPYMPSYDEEYVPTAPEPQLAEATYLDPGPLAPPPAAPSAPAPAPYGGGGDSGGGDSGGGSYSSPSSFNVSSSFPTFSAPQLPTIAPFQAPPAYSVNPFSYDPFVGPSLEQVQNAPGYAFARDEGLRALQNAKAARGTLNTGGTLKDILGWGNRFAEQNWGNEYNRAANTYDRNRGNAFENWGANEKSRAETYKTNYDVGRDVYDINRGTSLDMFDRAFRNATAEFDPRMAAASMTFQDIYNRDRDKLNSLTNVATAGAGY